MSRITIIILAFVFAFSLNVFSQKKTSNKETVKGFAFIPQGNVRIDTNKYLVAEFYISETEVSNIQYREFLDSLKKHNDVDKLKIAQIDTTQWAKYFSNAFEDPMVNYYSRHKAYNNYPVVNITYEGAMLYCQWLADKYNRINKNKNITYKCSLPTKEQFIRAARGSSTFNYSWEKMGQNNGCILGNFKMLNYENIHYNQQTKKYEVVETSLSKLRNDDLTCPVIAYKPNQFGVYNMSGNVAEMITEKGKAMGGSFNDSGYDVRVESSQTYSGALPFIGFRPVMIMVVVK